MLTNIASNKQVQRAALNTGYNLGLGMAKRIQQRRRRKGRIQLFPTVTAQPRRIMGGSETTAQPIRITNTSAGMSAGARANERGSGVIGTVTLLANQNFRTTTVDCNPADPNFITRLAKVAAVYQKFAVKSLRFRYVPTVGTNQNGYLVAVFLPDVNATPPSNLDDFNSLGGVKNSQVSLPLTYQVDVASLNKAFKVNYTGVPPQGMSDAINSMGLFCYGVGGIVPTADAIFGTVYIDYVIEFSDPKLSMTDTVSGTMYCDPMDAGDVDLYALTQLRGRKLFGQAEFAGWHELRSRTRTMIHVIASNTVHNGVTTVLSYSSSPSGSNPTVVTAETPFDNDFDIGAGSLSLKRYVIPAGIHYVNVDVNQDDTWVFVTGYPDC